MTIERKNDSFVIRERVGRKGVFSVVALSDIHFDSTKCDRKALAGVLDEAVRRGAKIMFLGDWLDAMQGKWDPRGGKSDIRPEYNVHNYFEAIIEDSFKFLKKYAEHIILISKGNHETAITKRHEIDPLSMLVYKLKTECKSPVLLGEYEGWIRVMLRRGSTAYSKVIFYTHGTGGSAPVTRGVIQTNRRQVSIEADIFLSGHIHTQWAMPVPRRRLNQHGIEELQDVLHLQLGTFKESHKNRSGYEAHKGFGPPSIGGYYIHFQERRDSLVFWEERTNFG